jgi:hypothetical protein
MRHVLAFLAVIAHDWVGLMSGGIGLVLTAVSFAAPPEWQPNVFLLAGIACLFFVSYRAWLTERRNHEALLEERKPRLEFVRVPSAKPYFEEMPLGGGARQRFLRVGIRNIGHVPIGGARVILEACEPRESAAVHLEHELQPMGKPPGTLVVAIPAQGTVVIDVAHEIVGPDEERGELHFLYAQPVGAALPARGDDTYALVLRAEGGGQPARCSIALGGQLPWRLGTLSAVAPAKT